MVAERVSWLVFVKFLERARAYRDLGKLAEALADLNRAISLDADFTEAYETRAALYAEMGQQEQAAEDLGGHTRGQESFIDCGGNRGKHKVVRNRKNEWQSHRLLGSRFLAYANAAIVSC